MLKTTMTTTTTMMMMLMIMMMMIRDEVSDCSGHADYCDGKYDHNIL
jgi:hypothetical protein